MLKAMVVSSLDIQYTAAMVWRNVSDTLKWVEEWKGVKTTDWHHSICTDMQVMIPLKFCV